MAVEEATAECFVINSPVIVSGNLIDSLRSASEEADDVRASWPVVHDNENVFFGCLMAVC